MAYINGKEILFAPIGNNSSGEGESATLIEKKITENGEYNASDDGADGYSSVAIDVPIPDGYIVPSGSVTITENGTHDVTDKAEVIVEVESSGDTTINGIVEQYKVNAGATVNAGDFVEFVTRYGNGTFNSGAVKYVSAFKLDNSRVLVAYYDTSSTKNGKAIVLTISEATITVGTAVVFDSHNGSSASFVSVGALSSSKAILIYSDYNNSIKGTAVVLTVDGTNITLGTKKVFVDTSSAPNSYAKVVVLSENKVLVVCKGDTKANYGYARVLTIDGTTITTGSAYQFNDSETNYISAVALSESKVLVAYQDKGNSSYGTAIVLTVSGTSISKGTEYTFYEYSSIYISVVALSESKALVALRGNSGFGKAIVLTISGTTITAGAEYTFNTATTGYVSAVALSESKALVAYADGGNSSYGTSIILTVDGTTITAGTEKVFDYNTVSYDISLVAFSENSALVAYNNGLGAFSGITIDGTTITADGSTLGTYVQPATSRMHNVGIAKTGGTAGETVDVYCVG